MSEPKLQPIWTPDDSVQTALDACQHQAYAGVPAPEHAPVGALITWKPYFGELAIAGTVVDVSADPSFGLLYAVEWTDHRGRAMRTSITANRVLSVVEEPESSAADRRRVAELDRDLALLDRLEVSPRIVPPPGWFSEGMRPGQARAIGRACVTTAVLILVLVAFVLWIAAVPQ